MLIASQSIASYAARKIKKVRETFPHFPDT